METGLRKDASGAPIPALFITDVTAKLNGKVVMQAQWGPAVAKNPFLAFKVKGGKAGDKVPSPGRTARATPAPTKPRSVDAIAMPRGDWPRGSNRPSPVNTELTRGRAMNRREFLQLLSAASAAGHRAAARSGPRGTGRRGALRRASLRQRVAAAHHRLPRAIAADLFPRAQCQYRRRRHGEPAAASRRARRF